MFKNATSSLANGLNVNEVWIKQAVTIEMKASELIPLIEKRFLTIDGAFYLQNHYEGERVVEGKLSAAAEEFLNEAGMGYVKEPLSGRKIVGIWEAGERVEAILDEVRLLCKINQKYGK